MPTPGRFLHVMLHVADVDATLAFYAQLGLQVQVDRSDPASGRRNLFLGFGPEAEATLIEISSPCPDPAPGFGHIALAVADVDAICATLAAAGIAITREPRRLASGTITAFVADPDGHAVELIQRPAIERITVTSDGVRLPVLSHGAGPALVMLHGGASRADHFTDLMQALGGHFRTIAYDQRGFAGSETTAKTVIDHERWAADVIGVLDALGIARATLLGWSMGASIAINAARRWPERIEAIVLLGAPDPTRQVDVGRLRERQRESAALDSGALRERDTRELLGNLGSAAPGDPALLARLLEERAATSPERASRAIDGYASRPDLTTILPDVRCPAHLIVGEEDRICPLAGARVLQSHLPQATLDLLPGCGHYYAVERPGAVADLIVNRLDRSPSA